MEKTEEEKWRDFERDLVKALLDMLEKRILITSAERDAIEEGCWASKGVKECLKSQNMVEQ